MRIYSYIAFLLFPSCIFTGCRVETADDAGFYHQALDQYAYRAEDIVVRTVAINLEQLMDIQGRLSDKGDGSTLPEGYYLKDGVIYNEYDKITLRNDTGFFEKGALWEVEFGKNFYYKHYITMSVEGLSDSTWHVKASSDQYQGLYNLVFSGDYSFRTRSADKAVWSVDINGSTSEKDGYSSVFGTEKGYSLIRETDKDSGNYYWSYGTFTMDFLKGGTRFDSSTLIFKDQYGY